MRPSSNAVVDGLPTSWQQRAEHHRDLLRHAADRRCADARLSTTMQRVDPDVAFRMPLGILRAVDQRVQLGPEASTMPRSRARVRPIEGRGAWSSSFSTSPQMRSPGRSSSGMARQRSTRRRVERAVEPRRELQRAQHAQAVVAERARDRPRAGRAVEIGAAAERIEILAGQRIPGDRVDREVAAARRLLDREVGIAGHLEAAMAASDLRFAPRQRDVEVRRPCRR